MLELLACLKDSGFTTFIVSGGEVELMRAWTDKIYGFPPERMVGSSFKIKYEVVDERPLLAWPPVFDLACAEPGKSMAIQKHTGRRPRAGFGNSDGDLQMLQRTAADEGPRLMLLVNHDDPEHEWVYDAKALKALEEARPGAVGPWWT